MVIRIGRPELMKSASIAFELADELQASGIIPGQIRIVRKIDLNESSIEAAKANYPLQAKDGFLIVWGIESSGSLERNLR